MNHPDWKVLVYLPESFVNAYPGLLRDLQAVGLEAYALWSDSPVGKPRLLAAVADMDVIIVGVEKIDEEIIIRAPRLKLICKYGSGVDNIDVETATRRGVVVTRAPEVNANSVAELTLGLILDLSRHISWCSSLARGGVWAPQQGNEIEGKTLGLIGVGAIGKAVAKKTHSLGMRILGYDLFPDARMTESYGVEYVMLHRLLAQSDYVSLHLPLTDSTQRIINRYTLALVRPRAFLVNTARAGLIDHYALYEALLCGKLRGVALDVCEGEPRIPPNLAALPNVVITPHIGGYTREAAERLAHVTIKNILAFKQGELPTGMVNPQLASVLKRGRCRGEVSNV